MSLAICETFRTGRSALPDSVYPDTAVTKSAARPPTTMTSRISLTAPFAPLRDSPTSIEPPVGSGWYKIRVSSPRTSFVANPPTNDRVSSGGGRLPLGGWAEE